MRGAVHNLVVDSYALQHPEEYGRSAKSYAAHLLGLCCGVEHAGDQRLYWSIARWLDGPRPIVKPTLLSVRGGSTIAEVALTDTDALYATRVRAWAKDVWDGYREQHALARQWLGEVRAAR